MTRLLLNTDDVGEERQQVRYAEHAHNGDNPGVAIQFYDGSTEFIPHAEIAGTYGEDVIEPFEDDYEDWVDY